MFVYENINKSVVKLFSVHAYGPTSRYVTLMFLKSENRKL